MCFRIFIYFYISVLKQRSGESVKVHQLDVAIPLHLKSQLRKGPPLGGGEGETESADTMPFVMLTRKGNKQQVSYLPVQVQLTVGYQCENLLCSVNSVLSGRNITHDVCETMQWLVC